MKSLKLFLIAAGIIIPGIGHVYASKNPNPNDVQRKEVVLRKMKKEIRKDVVRSFKYEDISKYVDSDLKSRVIVTLRVDKDGFVKVVKVDSDNNDLKKRVKYAIDNLKTDKICSYRHFRFPLKFIYKK